MLKASWWRVCAGSDGRAGGRHPNCRHRGWLNVSWWPGSNGARRGEVEEGGQGHGWISAGEMGHLLKAH